MNKKILIICFILAVTAQANALTQRICDDSGNLNIFGFIGPTLTYKFGSGSGQWGAGIEASIWSKDPIFSDCSENKPYFFIGGDLGVEWNFQQKSLSIYSEFQGTLPPVGVSIGPIYDTKLGFGWQNTIWANAIVGISYRQQHFDETSSGIGGYIKGPLF